MKNLEKFEIVYCRSGNIREVLIFANFAMRTNSRIKEIIISIALLKKNENSRNLNFVKSPKIFNSQKFKQEKITRSTVYRPMLEYSGYRDSIIWLK